LACRERRQVREDREADSETTARGQEERPDRQIDEIGVAAGFMIAPEALKPKNSKLNPK
jgi:hypothetical protein